MSSRSAPDREPSRFAAATTRRGARAGNPGTLAAEARVTPRGRVNAGLGWIGWRSLIVSFVLFLWPAAELLAQPPADEEGRTRFCAVDIFIDSGSTPLAAYQFRFAVTNGTARIVGIEGGEHAAFRQPPFYDPKAIQTDVAIVAAFSTAPSAELPAGKTRVATIHLRVTESSRRQFELKLQTAADARGNKFTCVATFEERKPQ